MIGLLVFLGSVAFIQLASTAPTVTTAPLATVTTTKVVTTKGTTATTTSTALQVYKFFWKWNNEWTNPLNWLAGSLPSAGSIVTFPPIMSTFGSQQCAVANDPSCPIGTVITIDLSKEPLAAAIGPPTNGKMVFSNDGAFTFGSLPTNTETAWLDRGDTYRDFKCSANWDVGAPGAGNPQFVSPCAEDSIDFSSVCYYQINASSNLSSPHLRFKA